MKLTKQTVIISILMTIIPFSYCLSSGTSDLSMELLFNHNEPSDGLEKRYDDEFGGGLSMSYMFTRYAGVRTSLNYVKFLREYDGGDFGIIRWNINARLAYPVLPRLDVFAMGGMGLYMWDADSAWWHDGSAEDGADLGYNWGFGADYQVFEDIDIGLQYDRHSVELEESDNRYCWSEISVFVSFHFDPLIFAH